MAIEKEEICKTFRYEDGLLYWKIKPSNCVKVGDVAGKSRRNGYRLVGFGKERHPAHRIIWVMHFGEIPEFMEIDHINHDRSDNRLENLRLVSRSDNSKNRSSSSNNTSGATGVYLTKHGKWHAQIKVDNKKIHLGLFTDLDKAAKARKDAEFLHGFHQNHGVST